MNDLFNDDTLIETNFGETIKVALNVDGKTGAIERKVQEFQDIAKIKTEIRKESRTAIAENNEVVDPELATLEM